MTNHLTDTDHVPYSYQISNRAVYPTTPESNPGLNLRAISSNGLKLLIDYQVPFISCTKLARDYGRRYYMQYWEETNL